MKKLINKYLFGGPYKKDQKTGVINIPYYPTATKYEPMHRNGTKEVYEELKWLYEHGFYNKIDNNRGIKEVDGLIGPHTRLARKEAEKAGYKKTSSGEYVKKYLEKHLIKKSDTYDTFGGVKRTLDKENSISEKKYFIYSSPHVKTGENILVPENDETYNMLVLREAKKINPDRWGYIDKKSGTMIVHYGGTPVFLSKVISGKNEGDGGVQDPEIFGKGIYSYLRKNDLQTSPAGILVVSGLSRTSDFGTKGYTDKNRGGEPIYYLKFAGSNKNLNNSLHSTPSSSSLKLFDQDIKRGSSGCFRFPNSSLRYIYDNGLLSENDTIYSKPEMQGNYLYIDNNNKVQMRTSNKQANDPLVTSFLKYYD